MHTHSWQWFLSQCMLIHVQLNEEKKKKERERKKEGRRGFHRIFSRVILLLLILGIFPSLNFAHCFVLLMCCFPPFSRNHMLSTPPSGLKVLKETHYPISLPRGMMGDAALIMWLPAWSPTAFWVEELTAEQFTSFYLSCMWWQCWVITCRDRSKKLQKYTG